MGVKKPDIIDLFNEIHDLDKHIQLVNKEVQMIGDIIQRLSDKAKTEEEYIRLEMAFERDRDLQVVLNELNKRRGEVWRKIEKSMK